MKDRRKQGPKEITAWTTGLERAPYHVPAPESLEDLMQRDLDAWMAARAAIAKAKGA